MKCPVFKVCGGCKYPHEDYKKSLEKKENWIKSLFPKENIEPILGAKEPYFYRNKVHAALSYDRKNLVVGRYIEDSHRIIETERCLIEDERAQAIIKTLKALLKKYKWQIYDEDKRTGVLRRILIRTAHRTGEILVTLVVVRREVPGKNNFVKALRKEHPEITNVVFNENSRDTSMILGQKESVAYGKGFIKDELLGLSFRISSQSFYQVNVPMTEILYKKAMEFLNPKKEGIYVDAYCGIGTISLYLASFCKQVYGVEYNPQAVKDAIQNAKANGIKNAFFTASTTGEYLQELSKRELIPDGIVLDPPRSGLEKEALDALLKIRAEKVVYISCHPEALKRDLERLKKVYQVEKIQPVDMFPFTSHVETVALLSKLSGSKHIKVELEEEIQEMNFKKNATYEDIKGYVMNKHGLKVSNLYIAQVKRKYALIERVNYNVSKKENQVVPMCPPEKEKAIEDALESFGILFN